MLLILSLSILLVWIARVVLIPVAIAGFIAITLAPVVDNYERHGVPRALGAFVALLVFTIGVSLVIGATWGHLVELGHALPQYSHELHSMAERLRRPAEETQRVLAPPTPARTVKVEQPVDVAAALRGVGAVGELLLAASFVPFLAYFMLSGQRRLRASTAGLFPPERRRDVEESLGNIAAMIRRFILGNVIIGIGLAVLNGVLFFFLGITNFAVVAVIAGFLNLVPYLGPVIAPLLPLAAAVGHVHMAGVLVIVGFTLGMHLLVMNVVYPKVIGAQLKLNPLVGTLALLVWAALWGPIGLLLGVPLTAAIKIVCDRIASARPFGAWLGE